MEVCVFEFNMPSGHHSLINRAMLEVVDRIHYDVSDKGFVGSLENFELIAGRNFKFVGNFLYFSQRFKILKYLNEGYLFLKIFLLIKNKKIKKCYFLSLSPVSYYLLSLLSTFLKNVNFYVVCHGELRFLKQGCNKINKPAFWLKKAIKRESLNVHYLLLADHINVLDAYNVFSYVKLNHPCLPIGINSSREKKGVYHIGFIGSATPDKRAKFFFELAERFKNDDNFKFIVTGFVTKDFEYYKKLQNLEASFDVDFVDEYVVIKRLQELDFALFFYDERYSEISSGAIVDAIRYDIPILCLKSKFFDYYESTNSAFFTSFEDLDDLERYLRMYTGKKTNIEQLQHKYSIEESVRRLTGCIL